MSRSAWHTRTGAMVLAWLAAAGAVAALHRQVPAASWLMVHLLLLGAVTTALLVWTWHFSVAVLRVPTPATRRTEAARLIVANVGVLAVAGGVAADHPVGIALGALLLVGAVTAHLVALIRMLRAALPSRFAMTVHAYVAAAVLLVPGIGLGFLLARGSWEPRVDQRLLLAHVSITLLGWVTLPILGTLVTLWPTILRTRMAPAAERMARRALPLLVGGTVATAAGALVGLTALLLAGVAAYLAGLVLTVLPMVSEMRQRPPTSFAAWSVLAGVSWIATSLAAFAIVAPQPQALLHLSGVLLASAVVGGVLQVLLGSLSYLLPVMMGGGPAAMRERNARVDRALAPRVVILNTALITCILPTTSAVRVVASALVLVAVAWTAYRLADSLRARHRADIVVEDASAAGPAAIAPRRSGGAIVGLATVLLAVAVGVAVDPAAVGAGTVSAAPASAGATATGAATRVIVTMSGMRFRPSVIEVPAGNTLTIEVVNADTDVHDLVLETGQRTPRLAPGDTASIEVGVVGRDLDGWCSVAGHRQMGMVLAIAATGSTPGDQLPLLHASNGMATDEHAGHGSDGTDAASAVAIPDLMAEPGPDVQPRSAVLAPASAETVHRVRLVVTEVEREAAPGVRQTRWTFGGTAPGPVLRGRVGDTFIVTLVNDGSIGHSIDFHAGALAPDGPMRTIAPGEELEYRFTATRSGIWMYHCSTMPISIHIANGMFGAVVIDPPDLAPVDREFVLLQSESYLGPQGGIANAEAVASGDYDLVSFNGYPMQYDHHPLQVGVGERVRIWVLAAGPHVGSAFHVVGGQFDTVYREGAYDLVPGSGGSQVLGLFPAQGGFVEFALPEAGRYPFVSHVMSDAEKGAHGIIEASDGHQGRDEVPGEGQR
ncbi:MAG: multicopper oxidase domain-containing protein [Actinomycetales bacterium]|nr:multicopper oxidase domain-containing protein [Actinomycetales bacterium]